jgi:hypothetical protein
MRCEGGWKTGAGGRSPHSPDKADHRGAVEVVNSKLDEVVTDAADSLCVVVSAR